MNWRLAAVLFVAGVLAGAVPVSCYKDARQDRLVRNWKAERAAYLADAKLKDQVVAQHETALAFERQALQQSQARRAALQDSITKLKATLGPPPPPLEVPEGVTMVPVVVVRVLEAKWMEQLGKRDRIIELQTEAAKEDSVAIASYDRQLTAMTAVAVIHQVKRTECEALLKKAPVDVRRPHLSLLGEVEADPASDSLQVTARVGLSAQYRGLAIEGGAAQKINGPRSAFVRGRVAVKLF